MQSFFYGLARQSLTAGWMILALLVLRSATLDAQAKKEAWRQEAQQQEQEQNRWEELKENLGSIEGIRDIAELLLGLTDPDTVVIQPEN